MWTAPTTSRRSRGLKTCTSAPFAGELKAEILRRWPGGLIEYYGMTEGGGSCGLQAHEQSHDEAMDDPLGLWSARVVVR